MPVAADVLTAISGALAGVNQQAKANKAEQLQALEILAKQPGASLGRAAAPAPANFLSQLVGRPYQPTETGAPVANIGGVPITVNQAPTLADALPELFAAPPEGMQTILPLIGRLHATPQAVQGAAQLLIRGQDAAETRKLRQAQQEATATNQALLRQRQAEQDARQRRRDEQEDARYGERKATTFAAQQQRAIADLLRVDALTPEAADAIRGAATPQDLTAAIAQHGRPKPVGAVKPIDMARLRLQLASQWTNRGVPIPPDVQQRMQAAQTPEDLADIAMGLLPRAATEFQQAREDRIAATGRDRARQTKRAEIRLNQNALLRMQQGDPNPLAYLPALANVTDPAEKARRLEAIKDYERNIAEAKRELAELENAPAPVAPAGAAVPPPAPAAPAAPAGTAPQGRPRILSITRE